MDCTTNKSKDEIKTRKKKKLLRMLEFFSGIGGMRLAIEEALDVNKDDSEMDLVVIAAFDISLQANQTYNHNFYKNDIDTNGGGDVGSAAATAGAVRTKLVEQLKPADVDGKADLWTMSPPCQPFTNTRGAKRLDANDKRCEGLKGIMRLLTCIDNKPRYMLLENVKGFVESDMRSQWLRCIADNGYSWKEVLLSPIQLGVPNHRLRYFIMCERSTTRFSTSSTMNVSLIGTSLSVVDNMGPIQRRPLKDYLHDLHDEDKMQRFLVPLSALEQEWAKDLGISIPTDTETYCFTAGYGRILHKATGSLLLMPCRATTTTTTASHNDDNVQDDDTTNAVDVVVVVDRSNMLQYYGRLRRLTPQELLHLFGFPSHFEFPANLSLDHQYKLIGNSVSVTVLTHVFRELLQL